MNMLMQRKIEDARTRASGDELEADLIRRALALRKERRIGILWAEEGKFFVSQSEFDPWGTRWPLSLEQLRTMLEEAELRRSGN